MRISKIVEGLQLLASVGVLIGIALLIYELGQNREMMRAQVRHDLSMGLIEVVGWTATSERLASIVRRGDAGEILTPDESVQYWDRATALFRYWQNIHYQYRLGLYDAPQYASHRLTIVEYLNESRLMVDYWCQARHTYDSSFASEIEGTLSVLTC